MYKMFWARWANNGNGKGDEMEIEVEMYTWMIAPKLKQ